MPALIRPVSPPAGRSAQNLVLAPTFDPANGTAWWGKNKAFHFDRLVSAWLRDVDGRYEGTVGIAASEDVAARKMTNDQEVHFATDRTDHRIHVGVPAAAVASGGAMAPASTHLVVAVAPRSPTPTTCRTRTS